MNALATPAFLVARSCKKVRNADIKYFMTMRTVRYKHCKCKKMPAIFLFKNRKAKLRRIALPTKIEDAYFVPSARKGKSNSLKQNTT